jgi:2-polyprenyl-6-hydroxyphenyl methylase/3-demethylubiquinone-9 3-methyltransferase
LATRPGIAELSVLEAEFTRAGGTDFSYFRAHYARFAATKREYDRDRQQPPGVLLDIGAHWLHQAMLWTLDGWRVVAMDLPTTFDMSMVHTLAARHAIRLLPNDFLERPDACNAIADDSIDVVLFTEIIEHITFNPVALWRAVHRVLRPGGTIVVTTPNYYALRGRAWSPMRFLSGRGGGLTVESLLDTPTLGHHWKEYSCKELKEYFTRLSADFRIEKAVHMHEYRASEFISPRDRAVMAIEGALPFLRPNLHLEIGLSDKRHGIVVDPSW